MIGVTVLNKSRPGAVVLVHGLFTSSGYWLPYLQSLKQHRLVILDIDYRAIRDIGRYVEEVCAVIGAQAGGKAQAIISHSLGCLLASRLPPQVRAASFEVCPVYCATRTSQDEFVDEIERKINSRMARGEITSLLAQVDEAIAWHRPHAPAPSGTIYLPDADPFFTYHAGPGARQFAGDHFDIAQAVADIGRILPT